MTSPFGPLAIVVNPRAGRGAVERGWPDVARVLDEAGCDYEVTITEGPGHATEAARRAVESGRRFVVAVGGDGTVHEVVNGLMGPDGPARPDAVLGVVAAGSGCDFIKTFGLPQEPSAAARHLLGDTLWGKVDLARVTCADRSGAPRSRWFANIAEAGLGAETVAVASHMPKWLGASVYRLASGRALIRHKPCVLRIRMQGRKGRGTRPGAPLGELTLEKKGSMVVVANGQFFGGGMRVAPRAVPGDGLLDVLVFTGPKTEAARTARKMFKGEHVPHRDIAEYVVTSITVEAERPILVEADGEVIGATPATFDVYPEAIALKV